MRLIKMLGLAAIAALTAMAFVGANAATADVPCLEAGHHTNECPAAKIYKGSIKGLTAATEPALLLGPNLKVEEECHGETLANFIESEGPHKGLKVLVEPLRFGVDAGGAKCKGLCTEVKGENPSTLLLEALTLDAFVSKDGAAQAAAKFQGCPLGVTCLYTLLSEPQLLTGKENFIIADHVKLNRTSGAFCPSEGFWDAKYAITKDETGGASVFLAALP